MFLFRRKKKVIKENPVQEKIANNIVRNWIRLQERWADFMQRMFERFSLTGKKYLLAFMCVLFGGFSLYLIAESLARPNKKFPVLTPIQTPKHTLETGDPKKVFDFIPESEYKKIERFQKYMDSLQKTKDGKKIHDSILRSRPKLIDSIFQIQKIYKQQNK